MSQLGRDPQPGLALLRVAQGRATDALSAMRRALHATSVRLQRARLLPALVEIALAAGDIEEARGACTELQSIASDYGTDVLGAMAAHARGAVELAEGRAEAALEPLRLAFHVWNEVGAPYIAARLRVLLARACRNVRDCDTAMLELDLARETFERLGARPDLAVLDALVESERPEGRRARDGLSPREQHLHQGGSRLARRGHGLCLRARPGSAIPRRLTVCALLADPACAAARHLALDARFDQVRCGATMPMNSRT